MKKIFYDFEVYKNIWLVVLKDKAGKEVVIHSWMDYFILLERLQSKISKGDLVLVGYNNSRYDVVMINYLLEYYTKHSAKKLEETMFKMSKSIILENEYYRKVMADNKIPSVTYEMDVSNYLGTGISAKEMGCRLHHPKLESLPFHPDASIKKEQLPELIEYCKNDVDIVIRIVDEVVGDKLNVVEDVLDYWNLPKEKINSTLGSIVEEAMVDRSLKPSYPKKWRYEAPVDFNFKTQKFKDVYDTYKGLMLEPKKTFSMDIKIGKMEVTFAMGGAHGAVKKSYFENLIDIDVSQYYPTIDYTYDLLPDTVKDKSVYGKLIEDKVKYGKTGDPRVKAVKESINSIYGRKGFEYSKLYAPDKLYTTTITGQLLFLRLIEDLHAIDVDVVYLNTDGITIIDPENEDYIEVVNKWSEEFKMQYKTEYFKRGYYRDVNTFVIEKEDGSLKRKGQLSTNPDKKASCFAKVSTDAVVEYLIHGKNIRDYNNEIDDLREFLMYHKYNRNMDVYLKSGKELKNLDNVVRYYLSNKYINSIVHQKHGEETLGNRNYNKNVRLINNFTINNGKVEVPKDLNREAYVIIAYDFVHKITGEDIEDNPYVDSLLNELGVE